MCFYTVNFTYRIVLCFFCDEDAVGKTKTTRHHRRELGIGWSAWLPWFTVAKVSWFCVGPEVSSCQKLKATGCSLKENTSIVVDLNNLTINIMIYSKNIQKIFKSMWRGQKSCKFVFKTTSSAFGDTCGRHCSLWLLDTEDYPSEFYRMRSWIPIAMCCQW